MSRTLRIATRQSPLATWQAEHVQSGLRSLHPELDPQLVPLSTLGDRWQKTPLSLIGGKNHFVKELEEAILRDEADIAVHSMKDVASELPEGFAIVSVLERESPWDVLVSNHYQRLDELPRGARVGTCSPRRIAQLRALDRGLETVNLRGNVNTRLARLDAGEYDAIILAAAGLERLGFNERIREYLSPDDCLPAVGQGVIGIEARSAQSEILDAVAGLTHQPTRIRLAAERAFSACLGGGCSAPIAAHARLDGDSLTLRGRVIALDGSEMLEDTRTGLATLESAGALGTSLAEGLLARGARRILDEAEQIAASAGEQL